MCWLNTHFLLRLLVLLLVVVIILAIFFLYWPFFLLYYNSGSSVVLYCSASRLEAATIQPGCDGRRWECRTARGAARASAIMRPSVVRLDRSGRPVVYYPPPPLLLPSGEQRQRPPLLLPSNQLLQLNPAMGRKRSRQNKSGQSRDRNSSYSYNGQMAVNGQTSRKRKAAQSRDSGSRKITERDGPSWVVKRKREKMERVR